SRAITPTALSTCAKPPVAKRKSLVAGQRGRASKVTFRCNTRESTTKSDLAGGHERQKTKMDVIGCDSHSAVMFKQNWRNLRKIFRDCDAACWASDVDVRRAYGLGWRPAQNCAAHRNQ